MNRLPQLLGFGFIFDIVMIDQLTKWWITETYLRPLTGKNSVGLVDWVMNAPERITSGVSVNVLPNFNLTMVWNPGVSFGLLQNAGVWPLVALTVGLCIFLAWWLVKSESIMEGLALGAIIGGAIGNLIDRFRFGAVADFFDVDLGFYRWPAFNIADSAIVIGVALLLLHGLFWDKKDKT